MLLKKFRILMMNGKITMAKRKGDDHIEVLRPMNECTPKEKFLLFLGINAEKKRLTIDEYVKWCDNGKRY